MAKTMTKQHKQLLAGGLTLALATALLVATALWVHNASQEVIPTRPTAPPTEPPPTLAPNPYGAADFEEVDGYMACLSGDYRLGVDVSSHQGTIDWQQVKAAGVDFAIIRIGYRGYGNGEIKADEKALENLQGAKAAGLDVGAYFFSQAISAEEAEEEAKFLLEILDGMELELPIAYDWEYISETARTANVDSATLNACAMAFCEAIEAAGYQPMTYFNPDLAVRMLDILALQQKGYPFWLALYSQNMSYAYRVDFWQYTGSGNVPGIETIVDLNLQLIY